MKTCHSCKKSLSLDRSVGRRDVCPFCKADIHCCLNCRFYDRTAPKRCNEPVAESVKEKAKANFCNYFVFAETGINEISNIAVEQARKSLDDLFKK